MKKLVFALVSCLLIIPCFAEIIIVADGTYIGPTNPGQRTDLQDANAPQQSRTGPKPPKEVLDHDARKSPVQSMDILSQVTLPVPAYLWRHGCGPTAVGMVVGYYDMTGFLDLILGSAGIQTSAVNQAIASGGASDSPYPSGFERHYEDYARPEDSSPNLLTDDYITEERTPHVSDCIADYMDTSRSTRGNYYGWSWSSDIGPAFVNYVNQQNPDYEPSYEEMGYGAVTWSVLTGEIDAGRPMVFLVDTDGDGETDHFVAVVGYRTSPSDQYGCLDTWYTTVRWENFTPMSEGVRWGICGGWSLKLKPLAPHEPGIIYVDVNAAGLNNGSSWADAYTRPSDALSVAGSGDEIWVAAGTYVENIMLKDGVALYGGFYGNETELSQRNWNINETIINGSLQGSVVTSPSGAKETTRIDGFTIRNGWAKYKYGGGMYNFQSSPTVENCAFIGNSANSGGGIGNYDNSSPTVKGCTFSGNSTNNAGGGMYNYLYSNPTVEGCTFNTNWTWVGGGGMRNHKYSSPTVKGCTFIGNSGTGMYNSYYSSPTVTNCTFSGNSAELGGGMCNRDSSSPTATNCTFTANSAIYGGGIYNDSYSNSVVTNCILWADVPSEIYGGTPTAIYSNVQGGWLGLGNIDIDPCFVDVDANDYHLKSEGWRWDSVRGRWDYDDVTSRCIDAGNPGSPLGDELLSVPDDPENIWGQNLRIDMGAFGGTAEASIPPYDWALLADLTNDGLIDLTDFAYQAADWLNSADSQPSDLNRDGLIDTDDLALFVYDWLAQTSWH